MLKLLVDILLQIPYRKLRYCVWHSGLFNDVDMKGQENTARSSRFALAQTPQTEGTEYTRSTHKPLTQL